MPVEARDDFARFIPDVTSQHPPIEVSSRLRIELVNALRQERTDFLAFGIISARMNCGSHFASLL